MQLTEYLTIARPARHTLGVIGRIGSEMEMLLGDEFPTGTRAGRSKFQKKGDPDSRGSEVPGWRRCRPTRFARKNGSVESAQINPGCCRHNSRQEQAYCYCEEVLQRSAVGAINDRAGEFTALAVGLATTALGDGIVQRRGRAKFSSPPVWITCRMPRVSTWVRSPSPSSVAASLARKIHQG